MNRTPSLRQIKRFLEEARHHGYDAETKSSKITSRPGVDVLRYPKDANPRRTRWFWEDVWVGSNPFSGTTTVWYKGRPCWQNHYWGYVRKKQDDDFIYAFLRWAPRSLWKNQIKKIVVGNGKFLGLRYESVTRIISRGFPSIQKYERI